MSNIGGPLPKVVIALDIGDQLLRRVREAFPSLPVLSCLAAADLLREIVDAEVLLTKGLTHETLSAAQSLRWIQAGTAGIDGLLKYAQLREGPIVLTNAGGVHGVPIAEQIPAMMLAFAIRLPTLFRAQTAHRNVSSKVIAEKFELHGQTLVVVGVGDIGRTLCQKAMALGMHVIGVRRSSAPKPPWVHEMVTADALPVVLPRAQHLALCLPGTAETHELIGHEQLALLPPHAYIYNVGRGAAIDQAALIDALASGAVAGAGLDVTTPEPPQDDSPLWDMHNVILCQHTSGSSPFNAERITDLFIHNLDSYLCGDQLLNVIDKRLGYPPQQSYSATSSSGG